MEIIERKAVPIYESICPECKSVLQYKRSEVSFTGYITCPVCGVDVWASTIKPAKYHDKTHEEKQEELENNIALLSSIRGGFNIFDDEEQPFYHALSAAISALNKEIIKHGHWEIDEKRYGNKDPHCSICRAILEGDADKCRNNYYCYHCGAKMDEVTE